MQRGASPTRTSSGPARWRRSCCGGRRRAARWKGRPTSSCAPAIRGERRATLGGHPATRAVRHGEARRAGPPPHPRRDGAAVRLRRRRHAHHGCGAHDDAVDRPLPRGPTRHRPRPDPRPVRGRPRSHRRESAHPRCEGAEGSARDPGLLRPPGDAAGIRSLRYRDRRRGEQRPPAATRGRAAGGPVLPRQRGGRHRHRLHPGARGSRPRRRGGRAHGRRQHHGAHGRRHNRRERAARGHLRGGRRAGGAHDRGDPLGARRRAGNRRRPAADAPRHRPPGVAQGGGRPARDAEGSEDPRLRRRGAARAASGPDRSQLPRLRGRPDDHGVQQRDLRPRHGHQRTVRAAGRGRGDPCVLPRARADEGEDRDHARQDLPSGRPAPVGVPHAPRRALQARPAHPALPPPPGSAVSGGLPLVEELAPPPPPLAACRRFPGLPVLLFPDSATDPEHLGRYSFLAADPATVVRSKNVLTQQRSPAGAWIRVAGDPLTHMRTLLAPYHAEPVAEVPPFQGGAAGYLGYDLGAMLERIPRPRYDNLAIPDVALGLYDWVIAWDHQAQRAWVISTGIPEQGTARVERAARRLAFAKERLAASARDAARLTASAPGRLSAPSYAVPDLPGVRSNFTRTAYLDAVARTIEYIYAGDVFQANLSQRLQAPLSEPPLELYARLRRVNPAPFAAYLDFGDFVVASASPERFLRVHDGPLVEARPIKGTRPRGISPEHDLLLALALAESEKDRAENVMIVDLLRNDLSRVCRPGTVRVPELFALEHYATVHHLVSTVVGDLAPGHDAVDLLRAAFPGGSITGAPKVRAMQIIAELEPTARGVYCGAISYLSTSGALDASIVIRTYLVVGRDVYFQVGGGIVADSDPEQEYRETLDKARGLIAALKQ